MWLPFVKVTDLMHLDFHRRLLHSWVGEKLSTFQNGSGSVDQLIEQFLAFPNGSASAIKRVTISAKIKIILQLWQPGSHINVDTFKLRCLIST